MDIYEKIKANIKYAKVTIQDRIYTGQEITLDKSQIRVTLLGITLNLDDYDVIRYTDNVNKGKASVTIKGSGDYGGTKTMKFNIKAKKFGCRSDTKRRV